MPGPPPAVALTRRAVRVALEHPMSSAASPPRRVVVGVSGGADSLALAAALAFEAPKARVAVQAVVVDHGLQSGSDVVARQAARECERLGLDATIRTVHVGSIGGPEAAARSARYEALWAEAERFGARRVMVAHTGDDQAEQVLLGLMRGSGIKSLAGMRPDRAGVIRPFLLGPPVLVGGPVMRDHTEAVCRVLGIEAWQDPHNTDVHYARVRARAVLRELESGLATPTLRRSLVRTAESAARDSDLLDRLAEEALAGFAGTSDRARWPTVWSATALADLDPALRIRAVHRIVLHGGAHPAEVGAHHLHDVERLLVDWRGQGSIDLPGHRHAVRRGGELAIEADDREQ